jgi:hypothetical protein
MKPYRSSRSFLHKIKKKDTYLKAFEQAVTTPLPLLTSPLGSCYAYENSICYKTLTENL